MKIALPSPVEARMLRLEAGLAQAELARRVGCSTKTVVRYESGKTPLSELVAHRYAAVLRELWRTPPAWWGGAR